jgi:hypothetical protein
MVKAGRVPPELMQKFFNKWVPTAFDLFGTDHSSTAHWAYVWGLKGRFDERENGTPADQARLNDYNRALYRDECVRLVERLNQYIPERDHWLTVPDLRFNRRIGAHAHQAFTVEGVPVSEERYPAYLTSVLPQEEDYRLLHDIVAGGQWIEERTAQDN